MRYIVFVVSDGTGRTAQQALDAALTQFLNIDTEIKIRAGLRTKEEIEAIVKEALEAKAFILHTIVQSKIRHHLIRIGRQLNVETIDLMGPLLSRLGQQFANYPTQKPGLFHTRNKEYFQRIDAMQFAISHDDGLRTHELHKSEIVLIGVSRTFKTPLSIYFAYKGWFVANIPIIKGIEPPKELFNIPPEKVFCLTTNAHRLSSLRSVREEHLGNLTGNYASLPHVRHELLYAQSIFNRQPKWPIIKVTGKSIEEIASEILAISPINNK
jgi:regulator of PEP synthase PpsR (kinase-PPPase family)